MPNYFGFGGSSSKKSSSSGKSSTSKNKKEKRALQLGLDKSGSTSLLYKLKLGEVTTTVPTIGFNVETLQIGKSKVTVWDVGGQEKIRPLWRHYLEGTDILIWTINVAEPERFKESYDAFDNIRNQMTTPDTFSLVIVLTHIDQLSSDAELAAVKQQILDLFDFEGLVRAHGSNNVEVHAVAIDGTGCAEFTECLGSFGGAAKSKVVTKNSWGQTVTTLEKKSDTAIAKNDDDGGVGANANDDDDDE